jgi:hypothetical protein
MGSFVKHPKHSFSVSYSELLIEDRFIKHPSAVFINFAWVKWDLAECKTSVTISVSFNASLWSLIAAKAPILAMASFKRNAFSASYFSVWFFEYI